MDYLNTIFQDVKIPRLFKVRQDFEKAHITDIDEAVRISVAESNLSSRVKAGDQVAIGVGSRGITDIHKVTRAMVNEIKALGAVPFIVPACGSHGNANAQGQIEVLQGYGVTEEYCGCHIRSSMDVIEVGTLSDGTPVYFDKIASEADAIIPINRIKAHTDITGDFGSAVAKMLVIGFGKHKGASTIHRRGLTCLKQSLREGSEMILSRLNVVLGVGIVENAYHQPAIIKALNPETLLDEESELLIRSKELMASLPADLIDLLIVEELGKDISGSGMDTNVIGRIGIWREPEFEKPVCTKIVVLRMTPLSHGNAVGVGLADFCPQTLVNEIDFDALYTNMLTATYIQRGMLPIVMNSEEEAIKAGVDTCWSVPSEHARVMLIKNTANIDTLYVSEALLADVLGRPNTKVVGEPVEIRFDREGRMLDLAYE